MKGTSPEGELAPTLKLQRPSAAVGFRRSSTTRYDAADAAAICSAAQKVDMRFVPVKSIDQRARLTVHRARQGFVESRTAVLNRIARSACRRS